MTMPTSNLTRDTSTMKVPGTLYTRAAFEPLSFNDEKGTVEVTWTTGARGLRSPWFGERYYEELEVSEKAVDLSRLNNGAPLLNAHDGYSLQGVIGVVERAWIAKGEGRALVRFSEREEVKPIKADVKAGIIRHLSVGYSVQKYEKVEGGDENIPVMRATRWTPAEVSFVPMGFDDPAVTRSNRLPEFINVPVEIRGEAPQKDSTMPEETKPPAPAVDAARKQESFDELSKDAKLLVLQAERARAATITALSRQHGLTAEQSDKIVSDGVSVDGARAFILEEWAKRSDAAPINGHVRITAGEDARDKRLRGMGAALLERSGMTGLVEKARENKHFGKRFAGVEVDGGEFRGMTLLDLAKECLIAQGQSVRGMDRMQIVTRAITFRGGGMQTTSDFSALFENVMYKMLLASYAMADDTWRRFCGVDTVPDFRASNRYRLGSFGVADDLNENGEFKAKPIPDGSKFSITTATKGNIIAISRQAIINDDMSALSSSATMFGRSFGLTIEVSVYALLALNSGLGPTQTDAQPFFHVNRANVNATGSALGVAGLNADKVVMGSQKDLSSNEYLNLRPSTLLVPLGLEGDANVYNKAQYDPADNKFQKPNIVLGLFQDVVGTPRLSGTRRYMFANDPSAPAIKVVFLEGAGEAPVLESEQGFEVDGMRWKARLDVKAQMFDPKGAVTNAGA